MQVVVSLCWERDLPAVTLGIWITSLPITPEKVLAALEEKERKENT